MYLKALFSSVCKSEICFFVKQTISVPCIMEGRAAFFQYVFPIRILLQLFAITAGIKFDLCLALFKHSSLCSLKQSFLCCTVTPK